MQENELAQRVNFWRVRKIKLADVLAKTHANRLAIIDLYNGTVRLQSEEQQEMLSSLSTLVGCWLLQLRGKPIQSKIMASAETQFQKTHILGFNEPDAFQELESQAVKHGEAIERTIADLNREFDSLVLAFRQLKK